MNKIPKKKKPGRPFLGNRYVYQSTKGGGRKYLGKVDMKTKTAVPKKRRRKTA